MNDRVAEYRGLVESLAAKIARSPRAVRVGAEYDDLVQEGLIAVWGALEQGVQPGEGPITQRMIDWIRHVGAQVGVQRADRDSTWWDGWMDEAVVARYDRLDEARLVQEQV